MNRNLVLTLFGILVLSSISYSQDTIRLNKKPHAIIKSWHPEFKEFPDLKIGESKIIFTIIPDLENTSIRDNDINLITSNKNIQIQETKKANQYLISVGATDATIAEFELWLELSDKAVIINQDEKWTNIRRLYHEEGNRILIDIIKLKIIK